MRGVISLMSSKSDLDSFINEIKATFPEVAKIIDKRMADLGEDAETYMHADMVECFSDATTKAIRQKDSETASRYLNYISQKMQNATELEKEYIEVYYTEPLMWGIKERKLKSWGWKLIPKNIKSQYEKTWGPQDL